VEDLERRSGGEFGYQFLTCDVMQCSTYSVTGEILKWRLQRLKRTGARVGLWWKGCQKQSPQDRATFSKVSRLIVRAPCAGKYEFTSRRVIFTRQSSSASTNLR